VCCQLILAASAASLLLVLWSATGSGATPPPTASSTELRILAAARPFPFVGQVDVSAQDGKAAVPSLSAVPRALWGRIAFESDRHGDFDLFVQALDGTPAVPLVTQAGNDYTPSFSPDGRRLVFASDHSGNTELYLREADGQVRNLSNHPGEDFHPAWWPDGSRIIFTSDRSGQFQIYSVRPDGSDLHRIGYIDAHAVHPRVSPDGLRIVYMRSSVTLLICEWNWDVWLMDADGSNQQRLTTNILADYYPSWSPDGSQITYTSCVLFDSDLYLFDLSSGYNWPVTNWFWVNEWGSVFGPDGEWLAFSTDLTGNVEVALIGTGGGDAYNLTAHPANDLAASWTGSDVVIPPTHTPTPSPTPTPTPEITYSISGRVTGVSSNPVSGVTIHDGAGHMATTDGDGHYTLNGLAAGTYTLTPSKSGYTFAPPSRTVSVPPNQTDQDFLGRRPPIVLVHGWKGLGEETRRCSEGVSRFDGPGVVNTFDAIAKWLEEADYDVWIAHLDTGPLFTPPIEVNAQCLRQQIQQVLDTPDTQHDQVILVAHSMGGLVSRACLNLNDCRDNVAALYTLGSPHAGVNWGFLTKLLVYYRLPIAGDVFCALQPAACQFTTDGMLQFNLLNPNRDSIAYRFVGGTKTPFPLGWLLWLSDGFNDGLVGSYSAVGWLYPAKLNAVLGSAAGRYWTNETHSANIGYPSYFEASGGRESQAFRCISWLLGDRSWADCAEATDLALAATQAKPALSAITTDVAGHLASGKSVSHTLQVDTSDHSLFYLSWITGTLSFTLTQPSGQVITPAYADAHPDVVTYATSLEGDAMPPSAAYAFTTTVPGLYTATIGVDDMGSGGTDYLLFAALETTRTFSVTTDTDLYQVGQTATFTGSLQGPAGNIAGATVQATLVRSDGVTDTLALTDLGGGMYAATYTIPDMPGYLQVTFTAVGDDGGMAFTRQVEELLSIAPHAAQLAGTYADRLEDRDGDGFDDTLALDVGVTATEVGTYTLSADLVGAGQIVAHAVEYAVLASGTQTVTIGFDGWDIRRSRADGPYSVTHVYLVDLGVGSIPAQILDDVWVTAPYEWQDFGFKSLHLPLTLRSH